MKYLILLDGLSKEELDLLEGTIEDTWPPTHPFARKILEAIADAKENPLID